MWANLTSEMGQRYADKKMPDFIFYGLSEQQNIQRLAVSQFVAFVDTLAGNIKAGRNLLILGPPGTGKDLMLANALRTAIGGLGVYCQWKQGLTLYATIRDAMRSNSEKSEAFAVRQLIETPILAISDPLPLTGSLTEFQAGVMFQIVDGRYRQNKPTWLTANVTSRSEMESRLGAQIVDRLAHNSEVIVCNWSSFREHERQVTK